MKDKLIALHNNSYAPYSKFRVSAVLVCKDGKEFNGVNIENAAYPSGLCAERTAINSAVAAGYRKGDFKQLYVMCENEKIGMPCFACRQVMSEFFEKNMPVTCMNTKGESITKSVRDLCPYPFDEEDRQ